ncbi:MAG: GtrA family protein [Tetrasphaera sp.]|nr:GtrA family protein [Tetrasphaera sp.]
MGLFNLLRSTVLPHKVTTATILSAVVATVVAWLGNRLWTFRHRVSRPVAHEVALFFGTNAIALLMQVGVVGMSHYVLQLQSITADNLAKLVGIALGTIFRFWAYRRYVFAGELT